MSRIQLADENDERPEVKAIFDEIKAKAGAVPAPYRAFARHPHILQADWNRTKNILGKGNLDIQLKESIALAVSTVNGCHFCVDIHRKNLAKHGLTQEQIDKVARAESDDEKTDYILKFCVQATKEPQQLTDESFQKLRNFNLNDEDILEVLTVMEMYTGYNKIIAALDIRVGE